VAEQQAQLAQLWGLEAKLDEERRQTQKLCLALEQGRYATVWELERRDVLPWNGS
jgi:hypothetical protein